MELDPKALEAAARALYVRHWSESKAQSYFDPGTEAKKAWWIAQARSTVSAYLASIEKAPTP